MSVVRLSRFRMLSSMALYSVRSGFRIFGEVLDVSPVELADGAPGGQVHLRSGDREIQELAAVDERRAGRAHVDLERADVVEPLDRILELGAPDDGILAEQESLALDEFLDGDELHPGDKVPDILVLGHEASRPGGRVLDKGPFERDPGLGGVSKPVADSRIGDPGHEVDGDRVPPGQAGPAPVPDRFDVDALVARSGIAVIDPEEGADLEDVLRAPCLASNPSAVIKIDLSRDPDLSRSRTPDSGKAQVSMVTAAAPVLPCR